MHISGIFNSVTEQLCTVQSLGKLPHYKAWLQVKGLRWQIALLLKT